MSQPANSTSKPYNPWDGHRTYPTWEYHPYADWERKLCEEFRSRSEWLVSLNNYQRMTPAVQRCFERATYFNKKLVEQCWKKCEGERHLFCWYKVTKRTCEIAVGRTEQATPFETINGYRAT